VLQFFSIFTIKRLCVF